MPSPPLAKRRSEALPAVLTPYPELAATPQPPVVEDVPSPPDDLDLVRRALSAEGDLGDVLAAVDAGRAAVVRLGEVLAAKLDAQKAALAEVRPRLQILRERSYGTRFGIVKALPGVRYERRGDEVPFEAIVRDGRLGVDFEFLP